MEHVTKKAVYIIFLMIITGVLSAREEYRARDFSNLVGKVKGLDAELLNLHFTLYQGYVKHSNALSSSLEEMRANGEDQTNVYGALLRRFSWEYDGMRLHELYFENMGGVNALGAKEALYKKIEKDFGSFEAWRQNFAATGLIRGIGWVILYQDPIHGELRNIWVEEHNINHIPGANPILVMDVWEHAYLTEFGLDRAKYIETFMKNINWSVASERFLKPHINERVH